MTFLINSCTFSRKLDTNKKALCYFSNKLGIIDVIKCCLKGTI